jgi:hypothetical protein
VDKLTLYDYLCFIAPGGLVLAAVVYGFELAPVGGAPTSTGLVLLTAAAFIVGHLNAAVANYLQPLAWGKRPGSRLPSSTGLFGNRGLYGSTPQHQIEQDFKAPFPEAHDFQQRFDLGYTLLRQKKLDTGAQIMNQQIGFYRNIAASVLAGIFIVVIATLWQHDTLHWWIWLPVGIVAEVLFVFRFRRFWVRFGNEIVRGVQALHTTHSQSESAQDTSDDGRSGDS